MKTVLVAGGAGFLGYHLCAALLDTGAKVVCVDDLSTGQKENVLDHENYTFIKHDITEPLQIAHVDQIYNLACPASPPRYQQEPIKTILANTLGVHRLLELAKQHNARFLQASTSEVYGDPQEHPQKETYRGNVNPIGIRACYDEGKRVAETLCFDYQRKHGVVIRVARIFNTYGPRMDPNDGRVVSNFIVQALSGEPITVYGDGTQTRSFCYVSDMVRGLIALMEGTHPGPMNLGNPTETKVIEIAKVIKKMTSSSSEIIHKDLPEDDPKQRNPDISLAKQELQWEPAVGLEEGLKETIAYFAARKA